DADGVIHDFGDGGVPVAPFAVVENAITADHEIVGIAAGEGGDDLHFFAGGFADAIAIGEVGSGERGHEGVSARVLNGEAELAASLIQKERAGLEDSFVFAAIKITEGDEVVQQFEEVAAIADEAVHGGNGGELRLEFGVLGDEFGEGV